MASAHIGARILLGKLCLSEERIDDALAIYEFVLSNFGGKLTKDQKRKFWSLCVIMAVMNQKCSRNNMQPAMNF